MQQVSTVKSMEESRKVLDCLIYYEDSWWCEGGNEHVLKGQAAQTCFLRRCCMKRYQKIGWLPSWFLKIIQDTVRNLFFWEILIFSSGKSMDILIFPLKTAEDFPIPWIQLLSGRWTLGVHKSYQMRPKKRERWEIKWWFSGSRYGFDRWFDVKRNTDYMGSNYEWTMIYHGDIEWYSL